MSIGEINNGLTRLELGSRFGYNLLEIRLGLMFLYSAVLEVNPFGTSQAKLSRVSDEYSIGHTKQ